VFSPATQQMEKRGRVSSPTSGKTRKEKFVKKKECQLDHPLEDSLEKGSALGKSPEEEPSQKRQLKKGGGMEKHRWKKISSEVYDSMPVKRYRAWKRALKTRKTREVTSEKWAKEELR